MNIKKTIDEQRWGKWELKYENHNRSLDRILIVARLNERTLERFRDANDAMRERIKELEAQVAALASQPSAVKYGCHADLDLDSGIYPDDVRCVISRNGFDDCLYAKPGMKPEDCEYWKPVEEK